MANLNTNQFTFNKKSNCFSAYISDLKNINPYLDKTIILTNPKTSKSAEFKFVEADMDGSKEDTYGWNYSSKELRLLIIND